MTDCIQINLLHILLKSSHYGGSMNSLKSSTILGICFVLITGTLSHFVYEWTGQSYFVGFIVPVNESTWEHMKLIFFPMLLFAFFMKWKLQDSFPCIGTSLMAGILAGTASIPIIYYTYTGILGHHTLVFDILTFVAAVLIAFTATFRLTKSCNAQKYRFLLFGAVIFLMLCFFMFTYAPPDIGLFHL